MSKGKTFGDFQLWFKSLSFLFSSMTPCQVQGVDRLCANFFCREIILIYAKPIKIPIVLCKNKIITHNN